MTIAPTMLQEELDNLTSLIQQETSPRLLQVLEDYVHELQRQQVSKNSLPVGSVVADFTLQDQQHCPVGLYERLKRGPVILSFYRGGWCPYCNLALKSLHHARPEIEYRKAQLMAISPESPEHIARTVYKNGLDFPVLHDANSEVASQFGIAISVSGFIRDFYRSLGLNLSQRNTDVLVRLPLPALYLIDTNGTIQYAHVSEDYRQRAEVSTALRALKHTTDTLVSSYV